MKNKKSAMPNKTQAKTVNQVAECTTKTVPEIITFDNVFIKNAEKIKCKHTNIQAEERRVSIIEGYPKSIQRTTGA